MRGHYLKTKPVYGVGINDANYVTQKYEEFQGKRVRTWCCPFYERWKGMIKRCYSRIEINKHPTYKNCTVCEEWLHFSKFKVWMEAQDWDGKYLDKDLLIENNSVYSPNTCLFVSNTVNTFILIRGNDRGAYPLGVSKSGKYFVAACNDLLSRDSKYQGCFSSPYKAHRAWQNAKLSYTKDLITIETDIKVKEGLQRISSKLQYHLANNIETKNL